jgi:hypothetical protein
VRVVELVLQDVLVFRFSIVSSLLHTLVLLVGNVPDWLSQLPSECDGTGK